MRKIAQNTNAVLGGIGEIPQIKRGRVWCYQCGNTLDVKGLECMRNGWPKCCGYTMSIDSPEERALQRKKATSHEQD